MTTSTRAVRVRSIAMASPRTEFRKIVILIEPLGGRKLQEVLAVPASMSAMDICDLTEARYLAHDERGAKQDPDFWARRGCTWHRTDDAAVADGTVTLTPEGFTIRFTERQQACA